MSRICFLDSRESELGKYVFEVKADRYDIREQEAFRLADAHDFPDEAHSENAERYYLSLPVSVLNFRLLDLPFSDKERVREVLPFELDGMVLGGSEGLIFDAVVVGRTESAYRVLAVYIEKHRLRAILEKLYALGIDPVCITSLELRFALKEFALSKLVPPLSIPGEERIALAAEEIKDPTINLRRNEFSYTRDEERRRKSLKVTATLVAMIVLILAANIVFKIVTSGQEITSLRNEIRKSYLELFPADKNIVNELLQVKSHLKELRNREQVIIGVKPLDVLAELSRVKREDGRFHEVTIEDEKITLRGEAGSLSAVQRLQEKLKEHFLDVSISDSKGSVQGKTLFTITAKAGEK
jgi:type II secretory pathway component PulL